MKTVVGNIKKSHNFGITLGIYIKSLCSFILIMELTNSIQDEITWCMLFIDNIVLMSKLTKMSTKDKNWNHLKIKGFKKCTSKTN